MNVYEEETQGNSGSHRIRGRVYRGTEKLTDEGTEIFLSEISYAQYFLGLKKFRTEPLFESSMLVHFRKWFGPKMFQEINEILYERMCPSGRR